ncbi:MAG: molybdopterin converting factor subunit 1 [Gammaproteobacteria bacterium]|nr:molybdopterin converting factor subunit 1 [Gammaproteobacteria bacterium]
MIKVLFFARLREQLDTEMLEFDAGPELPDIAAIIRLLKQRGDMWAKVLGDEQMVLVALNQEMTDSASAVKDGDEVAFFPPVTGG